MKSFLAAALFLLPHTSQADIINNQEYCLALNVYHEARSESLAGQYAVADVV